MPRMLDTLQTSIQGHLEKYLMQIIIHSQTMASIESCGAVFSGVKREPRRRIESA